MAIVHFKTCSNSFEAEVLKGRLAAEGIPCVLQGANASFFNAGMGAQTAFSVNVLVDDRDLSHARKVLGEEDSL